MAGSAGPPPPKRGTDPVGRAGPVGRARSDGAVRFLWNGSFIIMVISPGNVENELNVAGDTKLVRFR